MSTPPPTTTRAFSPPLTTPTRPLSLNPPSSVRGWSPARPLSLDAHAYAAAASSSGPRRTSSSFKHVKSNSLVSNSPFKTSPSKTQLESGGTSDGGLKSGKRISYLSKPESHQAIQNRFSQMSGGGTASTSTSSGGTTTVVQAMSMNMPDLPATITTSTSTPTKPHGHTRTPSIGLGIIADPTPHRIPSSSSSSNRKSSGGSARKPSNSRIPKPSSSSSPRSTSASSSKPRQPSGALTPTMHNPPSDPALAANLFLTEQSTAALADPTADAQGGAPRTQKQSMGLGKLAKNGLVSRSPFLSGEESSGPGASGGASNPGLSSPRQSHRERERDRTVSPSVSPQVRGSPRFGGSPRYRESTPVKPEKEDVFSSGSGGDAGYRSSPLAGMRAESGGSSDSLTAGGMSLPNFPFPPLPPISNAGPTVVATPAGGPSPGQSNNLAAQPQSQPLAPPTPTPTKSSITNRRLLGPRVSGVAPDSPSKRGGKTVTFREGPVDVKEFDVEEGDSSRGDGSFVSSEGDAEEDAGAGGYYAMGGGGGTGKAVVVITREDEMETETPPMEGQEAESMTGNFLDSLVEDGFFSPPTDRSPAAGDGRFLDAAVDRLMQLDTPSLGGSLTGTPMEDNKSSFFGEGERDAYGVPYGRSHHLQRSVEAHAQGRSQDVEDRYLDQPGLPREGAHAGEPVLRTANAAEPSIYGPGTSSIRGWEPQAQGHSHQDGGLVDPFVTIQTATRSYLPQTRSSEREEGGVPLGRTSHSERAKVARLMATQSLGLGMPRRPAQPQPAAMEQEEDEESQDGSYVGEESDEEIEVAGEREAYERYAKVDETNKRLSWERMELERQAERERRREREEREMEEQRIRREDDRPGERRSLPKPPKVAVVDLPEPVKRDAVEEQPLSLSPKKFGLTLPFSLPAIGLTSPLFASPTFPVPKTAESPAISEERPFTPPPVVRDLSEKQESPHRIPDFDFEDIKLNSLSSLNPELTSSQAFRMVEEALPPLSPERQPVSKRISMLLPTISASSSPVKSVPLKTSVSDFGPTKAAAEGSSAVDSVSSGSARIRPRISKDMIRQKMEEKKALSGNAEESVSSDPEMSMISAAEKSLLSGDKALPAPPAEWLASPAMAKSVTTGQIHTRPTIPSREQTLSAQEVLQKAQKEGTILNPKSALDKLVIDFSSVRIDKQAKLETGTMRNVSGATASASVPALPPKDGRINSMAASVKAKDLDQSSISSRRSRRSLSTGDARIPSQQLHARRSMIDGDLGGINSLNSITIGDSQSILHAFEQEVRNIDPDRHYKVRESQQKIYARADDKVNHNGAGDVDKGKAWRQLRRASDMNEYAKELRALKSKESNANKAFGTIFVKVLGIESVTLPMPSQPTAFCITLDNGIDYIRTPYVKLMEGARVMQEFALVEHANFEFALGLEIRRDPHIIKMHHANINAATLPMPIIDRTASAAGSSRTGGAIKNFFNSPRKNSKASLRPPMPAEPAPVVKPLDDNICRFFGTGDSTVGRTHIAFKPIAKNCDAKILEIRYPMFGMYRADPTESVAKRAGINNPNLPAPSSAAAPVKKQVAKITLQIFRLPPLPGLKQEQLPQSIDECLRGMRHHAWHEHEYLEGTLTQRGGDCLTSKRRMFKLIGGNLVATNPITKKEVVSVDLKKATGVEDNNTPRLLRMGDEGIAHMDRSFRLTFQGGDFIDFAADTEQEKTAWLTALSGLIGKIPSNPLWAELLAAQQRAARAAKQAQQIASGVTTSAD